MPITISTVEEFQVTRFGPRIVELTTLLNLPLPTIMVHPLTKFERKNLWGFRVTQLGGQKELASFPRAYYQALPPSGSLESLLKTQTRISMNQSLRDWAQDGPLVIFMHESGSSSVSFGLEGLMVGQSPEREGDGMRSPRLAAAEMEVKLGCPDPQEVGGDSVVSWACSL